MLTTNNENGLATGDFGRSGLWPDVFVFISIAMSGQSPDLPEEHIFKGGQKNARKAAEFLGSTAFLAIDGGKRLGRDWPGYALIVFG
jgi:hypothetical protein